MPTIYFVPTNDDGDGIYFKRKLDAIRKAKARKQPAFARTFDADCLVGLLNNASEVSIEEELIFRQK